MNPVVAFDFIYKHRTVGQKIIESCDSLPALAVELLQLLDYAARSMHSDTGWLAVTLALHDISSAENEPWPARHAANLILAYGQRADPSLREFGVAGMVETWHVIEAVADVPEVISAIPQTWLRLVPAMDREILAGAARRLMLSEDC